MPYNQPRLRPFRSIRLIMQVDAIPGPSRFFNDFKGTASEAINGVFISEKKSAFLTSRRKLVLRTAA